MERRFVLFLVLSFTILVGYSYLMQKLHPPPPEKAKDRKQQQQLADQPDDAGQRPGDPQPDDAEGAEDQPEPAEDQAKPAEEAPAEQVEKPEKAVPQLAAPQPRIPPAWLTLGSADPKSPYRMLVTLTNKGAPVVRIQMNSARFHDLEDRRGYLGHVVVDGSLQKADDTEGCPVQVVGPGTPADEAGLRPGDLITAVGTKKVTDAKSLKIALKKTKPGQKVDLAVLRKGRKLTLPATLRRRPLDVVQPENDDPLSFLMTLRQLDEQQLPEVGDGEQRVEVGEELEGLDLWTGNWEVKTAKGDEVTFRRLLPKWDLEITKTYRLAKMPRDKIEDPASRAYHLEFEIQIRNVGQKVHQVAYQLDGPTGLPDEGSWYARKVGREWGAVGLRDVVVSFDGGVPFMIGCPDIAKGEDIEKPWENKSLTYMGVDALYFASVLIPRKENPADIWFAQSQPLRVGAVDKEQVMLTDTSCRVASLPRELKPGEAMKHEFEIFAGPKKPELLAKYELGELIYYGWFEWFAKPLVTLLHGFYWVVRNYGLAIILLTVLVRSCMFPLSRKQALGAQKMQELQPEIKKLQEKHKKDMEARTKAQQELFRKHKYNPLSGCLVMFVQLPVFIALYRALMVDIELRQAPLISEKIRWCSNLAAPDMLFDWSGVMPDWFVQGNAIYALGPYFNILPIITVILFLWQQKKFMPPPADEQAAMQQKIMKFMMIFMGLLFFKVASGLCIYFIASSLWGVAERQFLPKTSKPDSSATPPAKPARQQSGGSRDGSASRKKKKPRGKR